MHPTPFREANSTYAKDQPEYSPLPAHREPGGTVTSCWALSWRERLRVLLSGRIWVTVLTFNEPLQPMAIRTEHPFRQPSKEPHDEHD